MQYWHGSVN